MVTSSTNKGHIISVLKYWSDLQPHYLGANKAKVQTFTQCKYIEVQIDYVLARVSFPSFNAEEKGL